MTRFYLVMIIKMISLIPINKVDELFIDYNTLKSMETALEKHPEITREELFKKCIELRDKLNELNNRIAKAK